MTSSHSKPSRQSIIIKKYANRRLYNLSSSKYITLEDLSRIVKDGIDFQVIDAKTEEDITRSILTQIIVEEEAKGENILPIDFLKNVISFYGNNLQSLLPKYLELSMNTFLQHQENLKQAFQSKNPFFSPKIIEETVKSNFSLFESTMQFFTHQTSPQENKQPSPRTVDNQIKDIEELQTQVKELQEQILRMNKN